VSFEETSHTEIVPVPKGMLEEDRSMLMQLQETKLQTHLNFARNNPRNIQRSREAMVKMATWDEEIAKSMYYSVPRGGKMVTGESIRFAETIKQAWPNCECDAIVLAINKDQKYVVVRGYFLDYETNNTTEETVYRPIRDKHGNLYSDDMIAVTCNAACSIAVRNAITAGIPRPLWIDAYRAARKKAAGGLEGLPKRRQDALKRFMEAGVAPDRVLASIGVRSEVQMTGEHITTLVGMWSALENGDATLDELFPPVTLPVEQEQKPKPRKTLADLGEEDITKDRAFAVRAKAIEQANTEGIHGFHKGMEGPPEYYLKDQELADAWREGWQQAKEEMGEDDEGEDDHENYSEGEDLN